MHFWRWLLLEAVITVRQRSSRKEMFSVVACVCLCMCVCLSVCSPRGLHVTIIKDAIGQSQVRWRLPLAPTPLASTTQGPQACSYLFNLDFTTEGARTSLLQKNIQTCSPCSPDGGQADGLHSTEMFLFGYADGFKSKQLSLTEFHIWISWYS